MRIASVETLLKNAKSRRSYAYDAMELDSMSSDKWVSHRGDEALTEYMSGRMGKAEMMFWAMRRRELLLLK